MIKKDIRPPRTFLLKTCTHCRGDFGTENFSKTKSIFFPDGYLPLCNDCLDAVLEEGGYGWDLVDKICQYADIPFIPSKFEELHKLHGNKVFPIYAEIFFSEEFEGLGWDDYFKEFKRLQQEGIIEEELPEIREEKYKQLREKWGPNYDDEALNYLENLYSGLLMTQNVNGALQGDQALKICKISYELDCRIRDGSDFDKMLTAYDKLVKTAEFTPKNVKSASDFDSVGELFRWLEKRGWRNKFFDDVNRDIVDETIMNIQNYNQRLYTNESGIGDEITRRIEALKSAKELEQNSYYGTDEVSYDLDEYDNAGFEGLFKDDEEFKVEVDDEE
jgi:hypothetical protein